MLFSSKTSWKNRLAFIHRKQRERLYLTKGYWIGKYNKDMQAKVLYLANTGRLT